jgi:hypothetical protein
MEVFVRLTTIARIPYHSNAVFGSGKSAMSDLGQPPASGSNLVPFRLSERIRNAAPIILPLASVATLTLAGATFWILTGNTLETRLTQAINKVEVDGRDARRDAELARKETEARLTSLLDKTSDKLTGLVNTTSTNLVGLVSRTSTDLQGFLTRNSAEVSEARKEISSAASQLTGAVVATNDLSKALGSHTAEIDLIKRDTAQLEYMKKELTENTTETKQIKKDTNDIQTIKMSVAAIETKLKSTKTNEVIFIESFDIRVDNSLTVKTVHGRVFAFPLSPTKAAELDIKGFHRTGTRLGPLPDSPRGWLPSRKLINNPPRILSQSTL